MPNVFNLVYAPLNLIKTIFENFNEIIIWFNTPFIAQGKIPAGIIASLSLLFKNNELLSFRPVDLFGLTLFVLLSIKMLKKVIL